MSTLPASHFLTVSDVIQRRRTTKRLADPAYPVELDEQSMFRLQSAVMEGVRIAGMAPFHHDRKADGIAEPWRVTLLWQNACRRLSTTLPDLIPLPPNNRLPFLLAGCSAAVIVTWLPETGMTESGKQQLVNEEHLAATAAFVQNLLLLLESQGLESYWASGGLLASPPVLERLAIPLTEKILAVVYVGIPELNSAVTERMDGKNRANRSDSSRWTRIPELTD